MRSIILLHGAIGAVDQLEPLAKELSANGFQTYSLNFSGHGQKSFQNQFGIPQFAGELKFFIEKNNLIKPEPFRKKFQSLLRLYKNDMAITGNCFCKKQEK